MRARNIKPGFFRNEQLGEVSYAARLLFIGLWCLADREGRMEYRPKRIRAEIFPYDEDADCPALVQELAAHGLIRVYTVDGVGQIDIPHFVKHQHPHHNEQPSELRPYEERDTDENSAIRDEFQHSIQGSKRLLPIPERDVPNPSDILITDILNTDILNVDILNVGTSRQGSKSHTRFIPPELSEVQEYASELGVPHLAEQYHDHYASNGWKVGGRTAMKDWRAAFRRWKANENKFNGRQNGNTGKRNYAPTVDSDRERRIALGLASN